MVKKLASNNITTNYNTSEPANVVYDCKKQLKFILSRHKKECKRHWTEKQWEKNERLNRTRSGISDDQLAEGEANSKPYFFLTNN